MDGRVRRRTGSSAGGGLAGGVTLGLATGLATALGYVFTAVLARSFTASDYGALVALLGAGLIGTIPAAGFQYVVARRTVALGLPAGRNDGPSLRLASLAGAGLLVLGCAVAVPAESWLHLDGAQPMIALATSLIPLTLAGAFQGALLGHRRFPALGGLYVIAALSRLVAGIVTALAGWGVSGAFWALAVAAAVSTGVGWLLTGPRSWRPAVSGPAPAPEPPARDLPARELPARDLPAGEPPARELPAGEVPGREVTARELPAGEVPGREVTARELPAGEVPGREVTARELPGREVPGREVPGREVPGREVPAGEVPGREGPAGEVSGREVLLGREVLQACSTVAGILVLTNTDVLLARHYLDSEISGAYGVASLFAKAILWGSQFVAQAAYPALAAADGRRRLLARTLGATAGLGLIGIAGTAVLGQELVRVATGSGYGVSTGMLVAFALLGLAWSVTQVLLLAAVAVGDRRPSRLLWALIAVEATVVAAGPHQTPAEILTVCTIAVLLFALLIAALEWTARPAEPAPVPVVATDPAATPVPLPATSPLEGPAR